MTARHISLSNYSVPVIKEAALHKQIADYLALVLDKNQVVWTTVEISNQQGGRQGLYKQRILKGKGVLKGFPDIQIFWKDAEGNFKALFLEVKRPKGARIGAEQVEVQSNLIAIGASVAIVKSVEDVEKQLIKHCVPMLRSLCRPDSPNS